MEADKNERGTVGGVQANVKNSAKRSSTHEADALIEGRVRNMARGALSGSGVFKRGQQEVIVANTYVSPTSVIVVTLVGNPGPVVVKYISLEPQIGFTVHLSAPAGAKTPFNYVLLMGELFCVKNSSIKANRSRANSRPVLVVMRSGNPVKSN